MRRRTSKMKSMKKTLCWLVVAAALTMGMAACSRDADSIVEPTIQEPAPTSLHITVGAGIANDNATTRADVVDGTNSDNKPTHKLVFTTGDRLYFSKLLENGKFLAGWLTMDGSPSPDGLSATFSGTVKPYDLDGEEISYDLSSIDPLAGSHATLVPKDASSGCFDDSWHFELYFKESFSIASDVNTLMKTALYVKGDYDGTQQRFNLTKQYPILNCALGGLTPNTAYTVKLRWAGSKLVYELNDGISEIPYASMVTTDAFGNVRFAISGNNDELTENRYWVVQLSGGGETWECVIGQKTFEPKIYNLTRILGSACTFIVNFNGIGWLTEITVSDGTNSKTLTDLTYDSGSEVTMLLPTAMNNKTLTVTATYRTAAVGGGTYTYVGTIPNATITADGPNNLGEVTLTKQQ